MNAVTHARGSGGGGGGKGGGGSQQETRSAKEAPNTLVSNASVKLLFAVSEGTCALFGGRDPYTCVYLDGTPIQASDGTRNFQGVEIDSRPGLPDQSYMPGFSASEAPPAGGINSLVIKRGSPVVNTVSDPNVDAVKVTIRTPAMFTQSKTTGDMTGNTVRYQVMVRSADDPSYRVVRDDVISGKCTSPYERSFRIDRPGTAPWDFRLQRETPDNTDAAQANEIYLQNYVEVIDAKFIYPDTALIGLTLDAKLFGSRLPRISFGLDGRYVLVPRNYNAETRTYLGEGPGTSMGDWDFATFQYAVTENPVWLLYDLITNERFGLGDVVPAEFMDRASLYTIAKYCDELVPNGRGGFEPRYAVKTAIMEQEEAWKVLQIVSAAFRGITYWGSGLVSVGADMPDTPAKLVTNANVIDGKFTYEGVSLKSRHTQVNVTWNDPDDGFNRAIEVVQDAESVIRWGIRETEITAWGAYSRSYARRMGKWLVDSERYATETVSYTASFDHSDLRPGNIIQVWDSNYAGADMGGRITGATNSDIFVDRPVTLKGGVNYWVSVVSQEGAPILDRPVVSIPGTSDHLYLQQPLSEWPVPGAIWMLRSSEVRPRFFRVLGVQEKEDYLFQITALEHDPTKYSRVELGIQLDDTPTSILPQRSSPLAPPSNLSIQEYVRGIGGTTILGAVASFTQSQDPRTVSYICEATGFSGEATGFVQTLGSEGLSIDFQNIPPGDYRFALRGLGANGEASPWITTEIVHMDGTTDPPGPPTSLRAVDNTMQVALSWINPSYRDLAGIEVLRSPSNQLANATKIGEVMSTGFIDNDREWVVPGTTLYYWVRARSSRMQFSPYQGPVAVTIKKFDTDTIEHWLVTTADFAQGLQGVELFDYFPTVGNSEGRLIFRTDLGKTYQWTAAAGWQPLIGSIDTSLLTSADYAALDISRMAGRVTRAQLTDGSITNEKLGVGSTKNMIWNSCCPIDIAGWVSLGTAPATEFGSWTDATWRLKNQGTGFLHRPAGFVAGQYMDAWWLPDGQYTPCQPGEWIEGQALIGTHRCEAAIIIAWADANGTYLGFSASNVVSNKAGGPKISDYNRVWLKAQAPANAAGVTMLIRAQGVGAGAATDPYVFWTRALMGTATVNQTEPSTWAPGGITEITGNMIRTESIFARHISVGQLRAEHFAVGSPTNVCWNASFHSGTDGWTATGQDGNGTAYTLGSNYFFQVEAAPNGMTQGAFNCIAQVQGLFLNNSQIAIVWTPNSDKGDYVKAMPVTGGTRYSASAWIQAHRCWASVDVQYFDANGAFISVGQNVVRVGGGGDGFVRATGGDIRAGGLSRFTRAGAFSTAPPGAVWARGIVQAGAPGGNTSDPYLIFTQFMMGTAFPNQVQLDNFVYGGVTEISGGLIKLNTMHANRILANTISTDKFMANSVTSGIIQAGAIKARELAANEIRAYHLAADFVIANSAMIGTAVIKSAQIEDLAVGTFKIQGNAATEVSINRHYASTSLGNYSATRPFQQITICALPVNVVGDGKVIMFVKTRAFVADYPGASGGTGGAGGGGGE